MTVVPGIADFEIREQLGGGGQADVYRAWDADHQRDVAIKVFHVDADHGLFDRERKAIGLLSRNDYVVQLYQSGVTADGKPYLVTEYADAGSLADHRFGWQEGTELMIGIASAVEAAHQRKVIHRDIKPDNVLMFSTGDGSLTAKLADFGIAAVPDTTTTTNLRGSLAYSPPEFLIHRQKTDHLGDIYCLGGTAYYVLTGSHPPTGGVGAPLPLPGNLAADRVWAVVTKALATDPTDRFPSATEFRRALSLALVADRAAAVPDAAGHAVGSTEISNPGNSGNSGNPGSSGKSGSSSNSDGSRNSGRTGKRKSRSSGSPGPGSGSGLGSSSNAAGSVSPAAAPQPVPAGHQGGARSSLWRVPTRLDSTRNQIGLVGALGTAGLAAADILAASQWPVLVGLGYVAGVVAGHGLGHD